VCMRVWGAHNDKALHVDVSQREKNSLKKKHQPVGAGLTSRTSERVGAGGRQIHLAHGTWRAEGVLASNPNSLASRTKLWLPTASRVKRSARHWRTTAGVSATSVASPSLVADDTAPARQVREGYNHRKKQIIHVRPTLGMVDRRLCNSEMANQGFAILVSKFIPRAALNCAHTQDVKGA
jgi:hypothetical protein